MSEAEYYWPGEDDRGWFSVTHGDGEVRHLWWNGSKWSEGQFDPWQLTTEKVKERGYLGVRREKTKPDDAIYVSPQPQPDDYAAKALAAFRACKQTTHFANWAMEFGFTLCQRLGAV